MVYIYALELENGKYYVGKTNNPHFRLENHFQSNGSEWTKRYKPLRIIEVIPNRDDYDEDKYTKIYMDKYGIDNVRGGSFVTIELDKTTIHFLKQMSNGTNDKCFVCGKLGHFAKDCEENDCWETDDDDDDDDDDDYEEFWECEYCGKDFTEEIKCVSHEKYCNSSGCFRCGRDGHYASSCYASKHVNGYLL